jgi:hypothetical protein
MSSQALMLVPSVQKTEVEVIHVQGKADKKIYTLTVEYTLYDGESGEEMKFTILGQGEDSGDKGTYKAMTGATKYALMKLFLIPTGDDPENDTEHRFVPGKQAAPSASSPPQPKRAGPTLPGSSAVIKFGEGKGKTIADLTDAELAWQLDAVTKAVAAKDPKWHKLNVSRMEALQAEAGSRITTGKVSAPSTTSARQAELGVDEEIVTPTQRFFRIKSKSGMTDPAFADVVKRATGKDGGFTHPDCDKIQAAIETMAGALGLAK